MKKSRFIYVTLFIVSLLVQVILIVALRDRAAITMCSIPSLVFAFCSTVYAALAFVFRDCFNLFFLNLYILAKLCHQSYETTERYRKEFDKFAFIYCVSIPVYVTIALFVDNIYEGIIRPLDVSIARNVATILAGLLPPFIKGIAEKKRTRLHDEAARKEQERLESMGKWK